jgi:hypothetical protein
MSTQYTINVGLGYWQLDDTNWHIPYQASMQLVDALTPVGALAVRAREIPSTSLFVAISAGHFRNAAGAYVAYGGTTVAVAASTTSYLWLTDAGVYTTGTAWPSTGHVRLAIVAAGATTLSSITDARVTLASATGTA